MISPEKSWRKTALTFALLSATLLTSSFPASADEFATIRMRWTAYLTAADRPPGDPATAAAIAKLNDTADAAVIDQLANGSWPQLTVEKAQASARTAADRESIWSLITSKMRPIAQAWATPQAKRYHDPETAATLTRALNVYLPIIDEDATQRPGNWWLWDIGTPMDLGNCLLLAEQALPDDVRAHALSSLALLLRLGGDDVEPGGVLGVKFTGKNSAGHFTGENAIWIDMNRMRLGLLIHDAEMVRVAAADIAKVCVYLPAAEKYFEGVTPDGSYFIHGPQIMWSYGSGQVQDAALATMLLAGTPLAMSREAVQFQQDLLLDAAQWFIVKYLFDPMTVGRGYARGGSPKANGLLAGAMLLAFADGARDKECAALAKEWLAEADQTGGIPDSQLGLAARVRALPVAPAAPLDGCRAFPDGDFLSIERPGWGAGLKMYSERTWPSEITNGEGLQSLHNSDGTLFLITKTTDWPIEVLAAFDWNHLPGATICAGQVVDKWQKPGTTKFVGTLADGNLAVAAQDLKTGGLQAHKSWLVFDDTILCFGSDVVGPAGTATTIAQAPVGKAESDFVIDGKAVPETSGDTAAEPTTGAHWAVAGNAGYVFLDAKNPLVARRVTRTGNKHNLVASSPDTALMPVTFADLYVPHSGSAASGYAYAILPAQGADAVRAWVAKPPLTVLAHDSKVVAAKNGHGCGAAVFWQAGEAGDLSVDAPCIALWKPVSDKPGTVTVSVADPTQAARMLKVSWKGRGEKSVEVKDGRASEVSF